MKKRSFAANARDRELLDFLCSFLSDNRRKKFEEKILCRTRHITIVLEDIFQSHNASAVLRTCDCFGVQDVHIIENRNPYRVNPDVALGASKWLTLTKYNRKGTNNTKACLQKLRKEGYRIVATTPHRNDFTPDTLPLNGKIALVFGTELEGLTPEAIHLADDYIRIPMVGFTESLNISVSAAVLLYRLTSRLRESELPWQLPEEEMVAVRLDWARNSIKQAGLLEKTFLEKKNPPRK